MATDRLHKKHFEQIKKDNMMGGWKVRKRELKCVPFELSLLLMNYFPHSGNEYERGNMFKVFCFCIQFFVFCEFYI